jgi:hypothetical protein
MVLVKNEGKETKLSSMKLFCLHPLLYLTKQGLLEAEQKRDPFAFWLGK